MKRGKKYIQAASLVEKDKPYEPEDAITLAKKAAPAAKKAAPAAKKAPAKKAPAKKTAAKGDDK